MRINKCFKCGGSGWIYEICWDCKGIGHIIEFGEYKRCSSCGGSGVWEWNSKECDWCKGEGYIYPDDEKEDYDEDKNWWPEEDYIKRKEFVLTERKQKKNLSKL